MHDRLPECYIQELLDRADVDVQDKEVISNFKNWCVQQYPYLPEILFDDALLINYILFTKRLEIAKQKIMIYYRSKIEDPEAFLPCDPADENTRRKFSPWYLEMSPTLTAEGRRVYFIKFIGEPDNFNLQDLAKYLNMSNSIYIRKYIPHRSSVVVVDAADIKLRHLAEFTPYIFKMYSTILKAVPLTVECMIYVNTPNYFTKLAKFISAFAKDKIKDRIFIYSEGYEILINHIPQYILPIEYGGTNYSLADVKENGYKLLMENRQLFLNEINIIQKYIEQSKAEEKRNSDLAIDDVYGTFKKLDID